MSNTSKKKQNAPCIGSCDCSCLDQARVFDRTIARETNFRVKLCDLTHANIFWYLDKTQVDEGLTGVHFTERDGVYILWHKDDYCPSHECFHMRALYVGKGDVNKRLRAHYRGNDTSEQMLIYFSFFPCENRRAKYIEQILLDVYDLPMNSSENPGTENLCGHFTQAEVD